MRKRKFFKRKCEYLLIITMMHLARMVPRFVGQKIFSALGALAFRVFRRDRERAVGNLAIAFPESSLMVREAIARATFKNLGRNILDFMNLKGVSREKLASMVEGVRGMEHFEKARREGKGVIVITGHIGCWEIMPAYFVSIGYSATVVARRVRNSKLNDQLTAMRSSFGVSTIDRDASPREMIRLLRRGEILGVLIDQHTSVGGIYVPFFNKPAFTPTGVAKLSCLTGAMVVPMAVYLNRNGKHTIQVLPPIAPPAAVKNKAETVEALTAEYSAAIENLIRVDPKQWVWFHHRWREPETAKVNYATNA